MSQVQKFCHSCGRIISRAKQNDRNSQQKYCSVTCRAEKPGPLDRALERTFLDALVKGPVPPKTGVPCGHVQRTVFNGSAEEEEERVTGMELAKQRERARRAGRRIVVFPELESVVETMGVGAKLECVQNGKVVEGSFAKGEWGVRVAE